MKILYFHQHFSTPQGSTGTRSYEFARRLLQRGHEVTMITGSSAVAHTGLTGPFVKGRREGRVDGIEVIELEMPYANRDGLVKRGKVFLEFAFRSMAILDEIPHNLIFATSTPLTAAIPGIWSKLRRRDCPFVFEVRDLWPEVPKQMGGVRNPVLLKLLESLEATAYRKADALIGLSPGMCDGIRSKSRPETPITLIPNGCDLELFAAPCDRARVPDPWPSGARFRALYMGTHGRANGLDAVVDTAEELKRRGNQDIFIGLIGDGALKPVLVEQAEQRGLDNIRFFDSVPKRELMGYIHHAHVGLQIFANIPAFHYGTSPNKFFDYIAAGLPVLVNYPGWMADLVHEHEIGEVCEPSDAAGFADALERLAESPHVAGMRARARALAEAQFGRDQLAEQFVQVLESAHAQWFSAAP